MDWAIYGALVAGFLAIVAGIAHVVVRTLDAWRMFKRLRRRAIRELDQFAEVADEAAAKAERISASPRLEESLGRLRISLARFAVLRGAFDEATDTFERLTWLYPRR
jgi:uncharacterized membrane protein YcjF (UPF0283 family)